MESISRRNMLAATAAGGLLTAASAAAAQTVEGILKSGVQITAALIPDHAT